MPSVRIHDQRELNSYMYELKQSYQNKPKVAYTINWQYDYKEILKKIKEMNPDIVRW
jgi:hypothetical protein